MVVNSQQMQMPATNPKAGLQNILGTLATIGVGIGTGDWAPAISQGMKDLGAASAGPAGAVSKAATPIQSQAQPQGASPGLHKGTPGLFGPSTPSSNDGSSPFSQPDPAAANPTPPATESQPAAKSKDAADAAQPTGPASPLSQMSHPLLNAPVGHLIAGALLANPQLSAGLPPQIMSALLGSGGASGLAGVLG